MILLVYSYGKTREESFKWAKTKPPNVRTAKACVWLMDKYDKTKGVAYEFTLEDMKHEAPLPLPECV